MNSDNRLVHVAHLSSVHAPFDSRIFHKECCSLVDAGYRVSLVVSHTHDETRQGVEVVAVPRVESRLMRMLVTPIRVARAALTLQADLYQFHDPELLPVGFMLRALGKNVVYDVHEDVPNDVLQKNYLPRWLAVSLAKLVRSLHWFADRLLSGIVVVTPDVAAPFRAPVMVRNYPLLHEFEVPGPAFEDRPNAATYLGSLTPGRGSRQMRAAAHRVAVNTDRHLVLAGEIRIDPDLEAELANARPQGPVRYAGNLDRSGVRRVLDSSRMGLFLAQPASRNLYAAYPIKVFEYMAAGIPVVVSNFPVLEEIVGEIGSGLLVDPTDVDEIAKAMNWLFDHPDQAQEMGRRGRQATIERYNFAGEAVALNALYQRLLR